MRAIPRSRIALALAAIAAFGLGCEGDVPEAGEPLGPAPTFSLPLLGGGEIELEALRGRTVILDFWATWCAPCEVQMPILDALWAEQGGGRLMVLGISVDTDPPAEVAQWVEQRGFAYPIAFGDQELAMRYGILGFPSLVVIDDEGRIRTRHTGVWSRAEIEAQLEALRRAPDASRVPDGSGNDDGSSRADGSRRAGGSNRADGSWPDGPDLGRPDDPGVRGGPEHGDEAGGARVDGTEGRAA